MGLFSRKSEAPAEVLGLDFYESDGMVLLGSAGEDMDAETAVVGESDYRDELLARVQYAEDQGEDVTQGRVSVPFTLEAGEYRVVVECGSGPVGYVEDGAGAVWLPRVREWRARGLTVMCSGVILWDPTLGDPRVSEDVPVGVRLDLVDQS